MSDTDKKTLEELKAEMDAAWSAYDAAFDTYGAACGTAEEADAGHASDEARAAWNRLFRAYRKAQEQLTA